MNSEKQQVVQQKAKKKSPLQHLLAGGIAGFVESSICHPLDTIKTRMQLRRTHTPPIVQRVRHSLRNLDPLNRTAIGGATPLSRTTWKEPDPLSNRSRLASAMPLNIPAPSTVVKAEPSVVPTGVKQHGLGPIDTALRIIEREGFMALYKGLSAVYTGIIPKMAIRFLSFEFYKEHLCAWNVLPASTSTFIAGLASGITEAVLVVTPAEVCKIRMQSQFHSMMDPRQMARRKYTNVLQTAMVLVREEGFGALYKGVVPTMLRQGCNQAANFTTYEYAKKSWQDHLGVNELASWQHLILGGISGGVGPCINNPLDVVKTRMQKQVIVDGQPPKYDGLIKSCMLISKEEGVGALWKGLTPRLLRIMPGQAITFMTYEAASKVLFQWGLLPK
jgi:solute carrier family 25 citrate transporter 1